MSVLSRKLPAPSAMTDADRRYADRRYAARLSIAAARYLLATAAELLEGQKFAVAARELLEGTKYLAVRLEEADQ